jgi:hypothetical protein
VANTHSTNLRDDIDRVLDGIGDMRDDIAEVRRELSQERRERIDLGYRMDHVERERRTR